MFAHLERVRREYARRATLMYELLKREGVAVNRPRGGFFLWVALPSELSASALLDRCSARTGTRVKFRTGDLFSVSGSFRNCFRLSYAKMDEVQIREGVRVLCSTISEMMALQSRRSTSVVGAARL